MEDLNFYSLILIQNPFFFFNFSLNMFRILKIHLTVYNIAKVFLGNRQGLRLLVLHKQILLYFLSALRKNLTVRGKNRLWEKEKQLNAILTK